MLISFSRHFIFIANTKAASTTIEMLLKRYAHISITKTAYGKHLSYADIIKHFAFIFDKSGVPADAYFRFGVIREPVAWVVSWYNYRRRKELTESSPESCHGISFNDFAHEVMLLKKRHPFARIGSQAALFKNPGGGLGVDYLIPLSRLNADLPAIVKALGLKKELTLENVAHNVSPKIINVRDVDPDIAKKLRKRFTGDAALFRKAQEGGFGDVSQIIRSKLGDL
jgi:hypothetical protein